MGARQPPGRLQAVTRALFHIEVQLMKSNRGAKWLVCVLFATQKDLNKQDTVLCAKIHKLWPLPHTACCQHVFPPRTSTAPAQKHDCMQGSAAFQGAQTPLHLVEP